MWIFQRGLAKEASPFVKLITFVVWLATALAAIYQVYLVRQIFFSILGRVGIDFQTVEVLGFLILLVISGFAIASIISAAEVHRRNTGEMKSLRLFAIMIGIEGAIFWLDKSL